MSIFVLLAGAWHTSRCWHPVIPAIEANGYGVLVPDLIGMGDGAPPAAISLAAWVGQIGRLVGAIGEPVVLVAHSRAGIVASGVAERYPDAIERLIYVSGSLIPDGGSIARDGPRQDPSAPTPLAIDADGMATLPSAIARQLFLNCTPEERIEQALAELVPEPIGMFEEVVRVSPDRFGRVPRAYVETLYDNAVPIEAQRRMQQALPCDPVVTLATDHSSFLSQPAKLTEALIDIARTAPKDGRRADRRA